MTNCSLNHLGHCQVILGWGRGRVMLSLLNN